MQETGKPTIILAIDESGTTAKGSGRSISALNLYEALNEVREQFTHFGGHHMAAGMTLPVENIPFVQEHLAHFIEKNQIDMANGQELLISESLAVSQATTAFIDQLRILAPFGTDNTVPTFVFKEITPTQIRQIGADNTHLKFQMNQEGAQLDAIAFQMGPQADELAQGTADVAGQLSINEWNGRKKPQLMVTDFAVSGRQLFDFRGKNNQTKPIPSEATAYLLFDEKIKNSFQIQPLILLFGQTKKNWWKLFLKIKSNNWFLSTVLWNQSRLKKLLKQLRYNVYT